MIGTNKKRFSFNVLGSLASKGLAIIVGMITIPVYGNYFSNDSLYGIWLSLLSVLSWILLFDFGFGNGMRNKLIKSIENNDKTRSSTLVSSTYLGTAVLSLAIVLIGSILSFTLRMNIVFGVDSEIVSNSTLSLCMFILIVAVGLQFFLRNISYVLHAQRHVVIGNSFALFSNIILLLFAFAGRNISGNKLLILSIAYFFSINIPLILGNIIVFVKNPFLFPRIKHFSRTTCKEVMTLGAKYFLVQLCTLILWSFNPVLISSHPSFDSSTVVVYTKYYKIFSTIVSLVNVAATTVWVEAASAYKDRDIKKIAHLFLFMFTIGIGLSLVGIVSGLLIQTLFNVWLRSNTIRADVFVTVVFVSYCVVFVFSECLIVFSNAFEKLKSQLICSIVFAIIKIPFFYLYVYLINDSNSWIGIIIINVLYGISMLISLVFELKYALRSIKNKNETNFIKMLFGELKNFLSATKYGLLIKKMAHIVVSILLIALILFQSGHSYIKNSGSTLLSGATLALLFIICSSLAIHKFVKNIKKSFIEENRKKTILVLFSWFFLNLLFLLSFVFNGNKAENIKSYLTHIGIFNCLFLFIYSISFKTFSRLFSKSLLVICVLSLVMLILVYFSRVSFSTSSFLYDSYVMDSYFLFYSDPSSSIANGVLYSNGLRLMGPFWEPGVFATILLLGMVVEIIEAKKQNIHWLRLIIFVVCLFLTKSTAGLMILPFICLLLLDKMILENRYRKIVIFASYIISALVLFVVAFFFSKKIFTENASLITRVESILYNIRVFTYNPFFGVGFKTSNNLYYQLISNDGKSLLITGNTSTIGILLASFGVWTILYSLLPIISIGLNKKITINGKCLLIVIFLLISFKENQFSIFASSLFFFYFVKSTMDKNEINYCDVNVEKMRQHYEITI